MTLPPSYFDDMYAASEDPWGFTHRWYERRKRALTLALLPDERYTAAYEPGCSIGVLTRELACRCDRVFATDVAAAAVDAARRACGDAPHVTITRAGVLDGWPDHALDLVVLSEVAYYFGPADAERVAARAFAAGGTVVAVHWRHPVTDYPLGGDQVHAILAEAAGHAQMSRLAQYADDDLLAEVWSANPQSVATRAGLA